MRLLRKTLPLTAGVLIAGIAVASAEPVEITTSLNLREGPSTDYRVIATMPPGAVADMLECRLGWCALRWRGYEGFAAERYLADIGYAAPPPPPVVYRAPPPRYGYYGRGYYRGPGITIRLGDRPRYRGRGYRGRGYRGRDYWR